MWKGKGSGFRAGEVQGGGDGEIGGHDDVNANLLHCNLFALQFVSHCSFFALKFVAEVCGGGCGRGKVQGSGQGRFREGVMTTRKQFFCPATFVVP